MKNVVELDVDITDKNFMFNLGRTFASGKMIKILNPLQLNLKIEEDLKAGRSKSFNMMIKYWEQQKISPSIFTKAIKRNSVYVISSIKNSQKGEYETLSKAIKRYNLAGFDVYYPSRDTNQIPFVNGINTGGFNICLENARAMASAQNVSVFYDKSSIANIFELGVASYLYEKFPDRRFEIENTFVYDKNDLIDRKVVEMSENSMKKNEKKHKTFYYDNSFDKFQGF